MGYSREHTFVSAPCGYPNVAEGRTYPANSSLLLRMKKQEMIHLYLFILLFVKHVFSRYTIFICLSIAGKSLA